MRLESVPSESFRATLAAQSLDIDIKKKSVHTLKISAQTDSAFNIGLIVGASGSGKTTLAKKVFGEACFKTFLDPEKAVIDQFPQELSTDECAQYLQGIGLSSVPCWIRPSKTLSNGQKARAEAALAMVANQDLTVIDEWTSVVDRTVAKVMSSCVAKFARRANKKLVLVSCHYDVVEWLDPDWIIDCNSAKFIDRRMLQPEERKRKEELEFTVRMVDRSTWPFFSKYHYLSELLPAGLSFYFGLFHEDNQVGFVGYSNYTPHKNKSVRKILHLHRMVIHPDYAGLGLSSQFADVTAKIIHEKGFRVMSKFSSRPFYKVLKKNPHWRCLKVERLIGKMPVGAKMNRKAGFRENIKTYSFDYVPTAL